MSTVRRLGDNQIPIMGIHIGGLGFLSGCMENNLEYCKPLLFPKIINKDNSIIKQVLNNTYTKIELQQDPISTGFTILLILQEQLRSSS